MDQYHRHKKAAMPSRIPLDALEEDNSLQYAVLKPKQVATDDQQFVARIRQFNSLSQSDFAHMAEAEHESASSWENRIIDEAEADDETEANDYEERKRRRSQDRKSHRQVNRRGSIEDYEQNDDAQFVQRIRNFNSMTGKELAKIRSQTKPVNVPQNKPQSGGSQQQNVERQKNPNSERKPNPASAVVDRQTPVSGATTDRQPTAVPRPGGGHWRKSTLEQWKEKAAELHDTPAFPPHQNSKCSVNPALSIKHQQGKKPLQRSDTFKRLQDDVDSDENATQSEIQDSFQEQSIPVSSERSTYQYSNHERKLTLQEWKDQLDREQAKENHQPEPKMGEFDMIEDQTWTTNVVCKDTLKRFKQAAIPSIASDDIFSSPVPKIVDGAIDENDEDEFVLGPELPRVASTGFMKGSLGQKDLIRDCLRVLSSMSRSGVVTPFQKTALKGLILRKDPRVLAIASRYRQSAEQNSREESRDPDLQTMELAMTCLALNIS